MYKYRTTGGSVPVGTSRRTLNQSASRQSPSSIDDGRNDKQISYHEYGRPSHQSRFSSSKSSFRGGNRRRSRSKDSIEEHMLIKKAVPIADRPVTIEHSFADFPFPEALHKNLIEKGYETPSPIQDKAILPILKGKDVVGLAATGTGKTAAFLLPLLTRIIENKSHRSLIVAPTRELALQIADEFNSFSLRTYIYAAVCVGGMPIHHQIKDLRRSHNIVIGTPGRIKDLSERGHIDFSTFNSVVLDEVDHMLDMGFVDEITAILSALPTKRQSLFFSATMPERIRRLVETYTNNPEIVEISSGRTTDNVEQDIIKVSSRADKIDKLHSLLQEASSEKVLIFAETKSETDLLSEELQRRNHKALAIHGDKHQRERLRALRSFKTDQINILVATDVAARGLDIPNVSHVINFTVPRTHEDYVHRIGRTGRASSMGVALTFVDESLASSGRSRTPFSRNNRDENKGQGRPYKSRSASKGWKREPRSRSY